MKRIQLLTIFFIFFLILPRPGTSCTLEKNNYDVNELQKDLSTLKHQYTGALTIKQIGTSHFQHPIIAVKLGKGAQSILLIGSHHGREWITSNLLMEMLEQYTQAYVSKQKIGDYDPAIFDEVSIWFVPMLNPDGVLVQQGKLYNHKLYQMNEENKDFKRWKANGVGIDLNRQYPSGWEAVPSSFRPFYKEYKGRKPIEAKEIKTLVKFVKEITPLSAISYHSSGHEIFWQYGDRQDVVRDYFLATSMSELTGYTLSIPPKEAFGAGFTDWFIETYSRPAFTFELTDFNKESNPPISYLPGEWRRNQFIGIHLATEIAGSLQNSKR